MWVGEKGRSSIACIYGGGRVKGAVKYRSNLLFLHILSIAVAVCPCGLGIVTLGSQASEVAFDHGPWSQSTKDGVVRARAATPDDAVRVWHAASGLRTSNPFRAEQ